MAEPLLALRGVRSGYGDAVVLDDVSLELPEHGSLAVLGRNGAGTTTLLLTILGHTRLQRGKIFWRGKRITRPAPHRRSPLGLGRAAQARESALSHTADALVLARGRIVHRAPSSEFAHDAAKLERFVGLRIS